ncbi:MAG: hypothetical protein ACI97K_002799 [Glaciecola sp.]|jgi:hypothetical protein
MIRKIGFFISKIAVLSASIFVLNVASAAVIYDEAVDGEIDAIGSTNVDLVSGVNQILGSIDATPPPDTDRIRFTQVNGLTIESIVLTFSGVFDDANIGQSMTSALFNSEANLFDDNFNMITSGAPITTSFFDSFGSETGPLTTTTFGAI